MEKSEDSIILVDKPAGISSFGVVAKIRRKLKAEFGKKIKVGHTGTLDPFATGLLILLSGKMTKKSNEFLKKDKIYEATLKLGFTSTTGDPEGEIKQVSFLDNKANSPEKIFMASPRENIDTITEIQEHLSSDHARPTGSARVTEPRNDGREGTRPNRDVLESTIDSFVGEISQQVPRFSAVKINGRRAYDLARKGYDFETPTRKVEIYSIDILDYNYPYLKIRTHVSSGTYIRTLAEDIGKKLGTGAYLTELRRIKIGDYDVKDAIKL